MVAPCSHPQAEMDDKLRALEVEARPVLERTQALSRAHANLESAYETANSIISKMDVPRRLQAALEKPIENEAGALAKYLKRVRGCRVYILEQLKVVICSLLYVCILGLCARWMT